MQRQQVSSGTMWEERNGYSRAVRVGPFVYVAGTLATDDKGALVHLESPYRQTIHALEKIEQAGLIPLGATRADVVRTRLYVVDMADCDEVGRAHKAFFGDIMPAATMVQVGPLAAPEARVEVEVEAVVTGGDEVTP